MVFFDETFLKKLDYLSILSKHAFAGQVRGERRAKKRGSGLEFADYRQYAAGDDFRYLDWKAYMRLNRLILRLYEEEEDLPIYFFVDASRSMEFGDPSKLDYARRVAAALCYIALANLDRINLVSFASKALGELSPQRGKGKIFKVFDFLTGIVPGGETDAAASFRTYCTDTRRRGLAVVISDFLDPRGFAGGLDVLRHFRHDVFAVHVSSREESDPDLQGDLMLIDSENGASCEIAVSPSLLAAYREAFQRRREELERYCMRYEMGYVYAGTDFPFEELILNVFRQGRFLK
ncbi:MAG TPA: DUF58 domain-containing protein [Terriglobia bacterium]|nr:DUF58 domain-containing protein [Terriglobia bacterium]